MIVFGTVRYFGIGNLQKQRFPVKYAIKCWDLDNELEVASYVTKWKGENLKQSILCWKSVPQCSAQSLKGIKIGNVIKMGSLVV